MYNAPMHPLLHGVAVHFLTLCVSPISYLVKVYVQQKIKEQNVALLLLLCNCSLLCVTGLRRQGE